MYRLYVNINGWTEIDRSELQEDIINTMIDDSQRYQHYYYMIKKVTDKDETITIRNEQQLIDFLEKYRENQRLKQMSCLELKNEITKNIKVKSLRK